MTVLAIESKDKFTDRIARLVELLISRMVNEIQTRAVNIYTSFGTLGLDEQEIEARLRDELDSQSLKVFEDFAAQTANAAINAGRMAEMDNRKDEISRYEYSAILDQNTCDVCEEADGRQASDPSELPDAPNPDCEGGARCRCFIVAVGNEEQA